ncbi:MAG: hypothetical protein M3Q44_03990 [bacterium]|nr:hypothetical protein [bacterium]
MLDQHSHDHARSLDGLGVAAGHLLNERPLYNTLWKITKFENADAFEVGKTFEEVEIKGNILLNEGINSIWTLVAGGSETAFSNANARIDVGDSTTAESASQTDLQASTNKLYKGMDTGYPTYGASQKITFRATFNGSEANYAWNEFSVDNGSTPVKNLNRKVSSQGSKVSGQVWQITLEITLS